MSKVIIVILFFIFAILLAFSPISEMREERKMKKAYDDINVGDTFISKIDKSERCVVTEKNEYHHRIRIISYIAGDDKKPNVLELKGFLAFYEKETSC